MNARPFFVVAKSFGLRRKTSTLLSEDVIDNACVQSVVGTRTAQSNKVSIRLVANYSHDRTGNWHRYLTRLAASRDPGELHDITRYRRGH